jgi:hypothetical protein
VEQSRPEKHASAGAPQPSFSSKHEAQNGTAGSMNAVPWSSDCDQHWLDAPWQEHVPQQHDKQQQYLHAEPAAAAAAFPSARTASSTSNHSRTSSLQCMLARLSSHEPQQPALLGFPSAPWMPLNPHVSGPPRPACEDARSAAVAAAAAAALAGNLRLVRHCQSCHSYCFIIVMCGYGSKCTLINIIADRNV